MVRREHGFTLIELLVAVLILSIGIIATIGVFGSSKRTTLVAQRHEMGLHVAQREMEALRSLRYSELGLNVPETQAPEHSNDPNSPNNRVRASDGYFTVNPSGSSSTCCEEMVTNESGPPGPAAQGAPNGKVDPGGTRADPGEPFTVGEGSSAVTGRIFRYVSWRNEECVLCAGNRNTKRLTLAVKLNAVGGGSGVGPLKPIWETSIASDPNEGADGSSDPSPPPPPPPTTSAQNFYPYDKRCAPGSSAGEPDNNYTAPTASHPWPVPAVGTYDTASNMALCESTTATRRPNLMGPVAPNYSDPPVPPFKYSTDLDADYPAGLAMVKKGTGCPTASYPLVDPPAQYDLNAPSKWSSHAWATKKFTQPFQLSGRVFLSLWATSVGSSSGTGRFCATLIDRRNNSGTPNDIVLGSMSREYSPWPTTKNEPGRSCGTADFPCGRQLSFSTTISATSVRADSRLLLVLTVLNTSDKDLVFLFDDPRYRTLLEVETSTPCTSTGNPCSNS